MNENNLFCDYYEQWVAVYKEGAVRPVTLDKYKMTLSWVKRLAPDLKLCEVSRVTYQQLLNDYAVGHERQTTMDFHHQLKGAIMDAVDDGLIVKDPTRKAIIKGKPPVPKKVKYLNQFELHLLLSDLDLQGKLNWDWMILLIAKTGIRFSEALAITPADFDFSHQMLSINKTWDYKGNGGFLPTKNKSSVRKIQIDWQTVIQFAALVKTFLKISRFSCSRNTPTIPLLTMFWNGTATGPRSRSSRYMVCGIPTLRCFCLQVYLLQAWQGGWGIPA